MSGVPQESILGPIWSLYTGDICKLITTFSLYHHCYVDDTSCMISETHTTERYWRTRRYDALTPSLGGWLQIVWNWPEPQPRRNSCSSVHRFDYISLITSPTFYLMVPYILYLPGTSAFSSTTLCLVVSLPVTSNEVRLQGVPDIDSSSTRE